MSFFIECVYCKNGVGLYNVSWKLDYGIWFGFGDWREESFGFYLSWYYFGIVLDELIS